MREGRRGVRGGGAYWIVACLSHFAIVHASLLRGGTGGVGCGGCRCGWRVGDEPHDVFGSRDMTGVMSRSGYLCYHSTKERFTMSRVGAGEAGAGAGSPAVVEAGGRWGCMMVKMVLVICFGAGYE